MNTKILSGKPVSDFLRSKLLNKVNSLKDKNIVPSLSVILVGDDPASKIYVNTKAKLFNKYGCLSKIIKVDKDISESNLLSLINEQNIDDSCHGILVQLPVPKHIDESKVIESILPTKDVDGFHPYNVGRLFSGNPSFVPCTPSGVIEILKFYNIDVTSSNTVIVGRSNIVGKPMFSLLSQNFEIGNSTVTMCHTRTKDLNLYTKEADIIIAAVGVPHFIKSEMVKKGVNIIDVGINRMDDNSERGYSIVGDVDYNSMLGVADSITPVPGGVGVMTVTMLLSNTIKSAELLIT